MAGIRDMLEPLISMGSKAELMFVGGEFYYDGAWMLDTPANFPGDGYFLNGGTACLTVIGDYLRDHSVERVLLPAYLCPSIVHTFERDGLAWDFYQVNEDLSLDLDDLARKAAGAKAVYFINYFGFAHNPQTQDFFQQLRQNGVLLIEDNAQAGFPARRIGDFAFNSIRKLAPYDGGHLTTDLPVEHYLARYAGLPNRRLPLIRAYRAGLYRYLFEDCGCHEELDDLYQRAEAYYENDLVVLGDPGEREQIERLDWAGIRRARRANFAYLLSWVTAIPGVTPIFTQLQAGNMPMGLPVFIQGGQRDRVYEELGNAAIGLTVHWDEIRSDPRTSGNRRAVEMAGKMLTLTIDQRVSRKQMDYLAEKLVQAVGG